MSFTAWSPMANWERALKEVARVIKPHGKLAIVEFKKN